MGGVPIALSLGRDAATTVEREVFVRLLDSSVMCEAAPYVNALRDSRIRFSDLVALAHRAAIPYVLFFAPLPVVAAQIEQKVQILHEGVDDGEFKLSARGSVRVTDIELIVKDIRRKQLLLRKHEPGLPDNNLPGLLRRTGTTVTADADLLVKRIGIDHSVLIGENSKEAAYEYLVEQIEQHNIYVSRSVRGWMPQSIPTRARFSGVCIRDRKVPFVFLNSRQSNDADEPAGRRILTLILLIVCLARNRFQMVSYEDRSGELIQHREYEIAEQILMPAAVVRSLTVRSLPEAKEHADTFCVTPSAFVMRALRLKVIDPETARKYLDQLSEEFRARPKPIRRSPRAVTALRRYNSAEYSRALLRQMDAGRISTSEIRRTLFRNRLPASVIGEFRAALG